MHAAPHLCRHTPPAHPLSFACRVDEIHMLVGAGAVSSRGGLDVSNLMKPALARGEISCIGATTLDEHRRYIERDAALERRFQPVMVDEASPEETLVILRGLKVGPSLFWWAPQGQLVIQPSLGLLRVLGHHFQGTRHPVWRSGGDKSVWVAG